MKANEITQLADYTHNINDVDVVSSAMDIYDKWKDEQFDELNQALIDKGVRIGQQVIVPLDCSDVGISVLKRKILIDILTEVSKKIKITEMEIDNGMKLSADILLINSLEETQWKDVCFVKQKQALIDKACAWIDTYSQYRSDLIAKNLNEKFTDEFRKAMEEEES